MILLVTSLGVFIAQFDSQVVNLALKHISGDLHASVSQLQWVMDSYNLVYASLLLTGGTLGDLYGRTRVFVGGFALILIGSIICLVAPNALTLIAGRAVTGIGAALTVPTSLSILTVAYPDAKKRATALGIWASCNGVAIALGPTVGGLVVDAWGWRAVCALVMPICVAAALLALKFVPETRHAKDRSLDAAGQILAIVALGALCFAAIEAPHVGWTSALSISALAIFVISTASFLLTERGKRGAMVPLDLFQKSEFNAALIAAAAMTFGMYGMIFLLPLYLQEVGHASAFTVGLELLPMSVVFIIVSQLSGALAARLGARMLTTAGLTLMGCGLLVLANISATPSMPLILSSMLVIGVGLGLNTAPVNAVAVSSVAATRTGTASGLVNTARMIGATLGIAILGAVYAVHARQGDIQSTVTGMRLAYLIGGGVELSGALIAFLFIRADSMEQHQPVGAR